MEARKQGSHCWERRRHRLLVPLKSTLEMLRQAGTPAVPVLTFSVSRCRLLKGAFIFLLACFVLFAPSQADAQKVVDKMVATVSAGAQTDLITYSDLMWQLALQPESPVEDPSSLALNSALRLLIDQRLILQEAEKLPTIAPNQKEISDAREELARQFPSGELQRRMLKVGLTADKLNEIVEQRLKMEKYLDFRFRNFVVISPQEVDDYYRTVFVPRFKSRNPGRIVPPLDEVKSRLERQMTERRIESDTDQFLDTARERAEIVILNPV